MVPLSTIAGGVLTALAFPEPGLTPLAWIGPIPLLWWGSGAGAKKGALLGGLWGAAFFGTLLYWISLVGILAWLALVALQTIFTVGFGAIWGVLSSRLVGVLRVTAAGAAWVTVVELARANLPFGGFPWGQLAQSQTGSTFAMKAAAVGGSWVVAFVMMGVAAAVVEMGRSGSRGLRKALPAWAVLIVVAVAGVAFPYQEREAGTLDVAIVQGNIPRDMEPSLEKDLLIARSHRHLTQELDDVDLVVWPESSVGADPEQVEESGLVIADAARAVGAPMIVGGDHEREDGRYQVMAFLISPEGEIVDRYQKTHLVPFGEYVPVRRVFGGIPALQQVPRDAVPGNRDAIFDVKGARIAPVISFEGDFGSLVRARVAKGAQAVVIATNTSTWGESWASVQHLAMARLRAAETGVPVIHAALTGTSAFVAPNASVARSTPLWVPAVLQQEVTLSGTVTPYVRWGDVVAWLCALALIALAVTAHRRPARIAL